MNSEIKSASAAKEVAAILKKYGVPGVVLVGDHYVCELTPVLESVDYFSVSGQDKSKLKDEEKRTRLQDAAKTFSSILTSARRCEHEMIQLLAPVGRHITTYHVS